MPFLRCGYILVEHNCDFRKTFFCFKFTVIECLVCQLFSPWTKPAWPFWKICSSVTQRARDVFKQWAQRQSTPCTGRWLKHPEMISSARPLENCSSPEHTFCKGSDLNTEEHRKPQTNPVVDWFKQLSESFLFAFFVLFFCFVLLSPPSFILTSKNGLQQVQQIY